LTTELATTTHQGLQAQMDYARAVQTAGLLPTAYRGKPADILIAIGLGESMGLSPVESLYRIDVIQGKPTASAELIAANVRKAGHKLRVKLDEATTTATATIIRADDPDFEHVVVRNLGWAKQMGLTGKDNYAKQPLTMLQHRAVTAVARMACPEALYGVAYTPDEMGDLPRTVEVEGDGLLQQVWDQVQFNKTTAVPPHTPNRTVTQLPRSVPTEPVEAVEAELVDDTPSAVDQLRAEWMTATPERQSEIEAEVARIEAEGAVTE
jgi:hypothetical protein